MRSDFDKTDMPGRLTSTDSGTALAEHSKHCFPMVKKKWLYSYHKNKMYIQDFKTRILIMNIPHVDFKKHKMTA